MKQAVGEDRGGGEEQANRLIAGEDAALVFSAGVALLPGGVTLYFVVHTCRLWPRRPGGLAEV